MLVLAVKPRNADDSSEALRASGSIPAVFYGPKEPSTPIAVDGRDLERIWRDAGETTIITLKGLKENVDTLIRDVQVHPVTGVLLHADFYVLEKGKKIEIAVPLHFVGEAPAEKLGHILVKVLHEVEIEVSAAELPHSLDVDISVLANPGDHITASQIKLPSSATLITEPEETVASITEFHEEKAQETAAPEEAAGTGAEGGAETSATETTEE